ncbi:MAG: peptidoglycan DD-metalloendopeptidase family protein [Alphaproteobacteria bacterium]|nr:peptidoglycan DD-metalloendopeptidase family protein [Alphaproteobacteria bacterium]
MRFFSLLMLSSVMLVGSCAPSSSLAPVHSYGGGSGGGSLGLHTVSKGETVWLISQKYRVELRDVLEANHLFAPYRLTKGMRIGIPAPRTYQIRSGDTLYKVSRLFETSTTELVQLNRFKSPYVFRVGQVIRIPMKKKPSETKKEIPLSRTAAKIALPDVRKNNGITREVLPPLAGMAPQTEQREKKEEPVPIQATPSRSGGFIKPVNGRIISRFGPKADGLHNDGINIQARKGDPVRAAENGVVVYANKQIEGYGNLVLIRHAEQYVSAYAHLDRILVRKGEGVKRGQTIGTVGTSGRVEKPQLHFEIRKGTEALDPQTHIGL